MPTQQVRPPAFLTGKIDLQQSGMGLREKLWLAAAVVLVPVVIFFQQFTRDLHGQTLSSAPRAMLEIEVPEHPGFSDLTIRSKLAVWSSGAEDELPAAEVFAELQELAITRADRLRLALVAGELLGKEAALQRLQALEQEASPGGELAGEIAWFRRSYEADGEELPSEIHDALVDRHGWFAQLALSHGLPDFNHERQQAIGGIAGLLMLESMTGLVSLGALIGGLVVVILGVMRWREGELEFRLQDSVGGPVYLELFVLFVGGFGLLLSMHLILFGMNAEGSSAAIALQEVLMWCLVAALAWPLLRRVPWSRYAWDVGLHRGDGVFQEVRAGFFGWLASSPILLGLALATQLVAGEGSNADPGGYPLFESPRANSWLIVLLGMTSAVFWAPLVEEIVFRGALQRYLRPWLQWWGAIMVTALAFGLIHPYTTSGLVQVAVGGVLFGLLREWRGSLIAPVTAHFLHNGTIVGFTIAFLAVME